MSLSNDPFKTEMSTYIKISDPMFPAPKFSVYIVD